MADCVLERPTLTGCCYRVALAGSRGCAAMAARMLQRGDVRTRVSVPIVNQILAAMCGLWRLLPPDTRPTRSARKESTKITLQTSSVRRNCARSCLNPLKRSMMSNGIVESSVRPRSVSQIQ